MYFFHKMEKCRATASRAIRVMGFLCRTSFFGGIEREKKNTYEGILVVFPLCGAVSVWNLTYIEAQNMAIDSLLVPLFRDYVEGLQVQFFFLYGSDATFAFIRLRILKRCVNSEVAVIFHKQASYEFVFALFFMYKLIPYLNILEIHFKEQEEATGATSWEEGRWRDHCFVLTRNCCTEWLWPWRCREAAASLWSLLFWMFPSCIPSQVPQEINVKSVDLLLIYCRRCNSELLVNISIQVEETDQNVVDIVHNFPCFLRS